MGYTKFFKYWLSIVLWLGFIFLMSTGALSSAHTSRFIGPLLRFLMPDISAEVLQLVHGVIRKCAHVTEYFILGLLLFRALRASFAGVSIVAIAFSSLLIVVAFAATDEFHQSFVASRTASAMDVGFDALGGMLAQSVHLLLEYRRRVKRIGVR